jgi:hypothetical protein
MTPRVNRPVHGLLPATEPTFPPMSYGWGILPSPPTVPPDDSADLPIPCSEFYEILTDL